MCCKSTLVQAMTNFPSPRSLMLASYFNLSDVWFYWYFILIAISKNFNCGAILWIRWNATFFDKPAHKRFPDQQNMQKHSKQNVFAWFCFKIFKTSKVFLKILLQNRIFKETALTIRVKVLNFFQICRVNYV